MLTAKKLATGLACGELAPRDIVSLLQSAIEKSEEQVCAWQTLCWDTVDQQVETLKADAADNRPPLWGVPVGVKDIFATHDFPTEYGSGIYNGHRPGFDAACVARLRAAGAIIPGKTVTTEFAYWRAGKTRNPISGDYSPGGSSSGSAAAVAAGMVPVAIGSQTAASTIRPAAYCGIIGFKPSRGVISLAGVKALANSLDTVGVFGTTIDDVALVTGVMANRPELARLPPRARAPVCRVWDGPELASASPAAQDAFQAALDALELAGVSVQRLPLPGDAGELGQKQTTIMNVEAARELAYEWHSFRKELSEPLAKLIADGECTPPAQYDEATNGRDNWIARIEELFGSARILLLPSAPDIAPRFGDGTGDPVMSRAWTMLGLPSISLPCGVGRDRMPFGLQLAARPGDDSLLLNAARTIEEFLPKQSSVKSTE